MGSHCLLKTFAVDDVVQVVGRALRLVETAVWPAARDSMAQEGERLARPAP
jgi:hypothetical protein